MPPSLWQAARNQMSVHQSWSLRLDHGSALWKERRYKAAMVIDWYLERESSTILFRPRCSNTVYVEPVTNLAGNADLLGENSPVGVQLRLFRPPVLVVCLRPEPAVPRGENMPWFLWMLSASNEMASQWTLAFSPCMESRAQTPNSRGIYTSL